MYKTLSEPLLRDAALFYQLDKTLKASPNVANNNLDPMISELIAHAAGLIAAYPEPLQRYERILAYSELLEKLTNHAAAALEAVKKADENEK